MKYYNKVATRGTEITFASHDKSFVRIESFFPFEESVEDIERDIKKLQSIKQEIENISCDES